MLFRVFLNTYLKFSVQTLISIPVLDFEGILSKQL